MTTLDERGKAVADADGTCPRCGTRRADDQRYCLECGLPLPIVTGRLPAMRRRWIRRFGWYPGDWMWPALLALLIAAAGAAAAIVVSDHRSSAQPEVAVAAAGISLGAPVTSAPTGTKPPSTADTAKLPTAPEPSVLPSRITWPPSENGWTIVLVSYPKTFGHDEAVTTAKRAAKTGLNQVGVIDSSRYASLQPGYFVVFTGVYGSKTDADASVATAKQAGFPGAYSREIAR